jgi:hypothetical protein
MYFSEEPAMRRFLVIWMCEMLLLMQATSAAVPGAANAFEVFKSFAGRWSIQADGKTLTTEMLYDVGSKGSIVTEQFGKELSVFYIDGQHLSMTHYCNAGNQPRLRLKEGGTPGLFEFEMFDITSSSGDPAEPHVQKIIYKRIDDKHLDLEIIWKKGTLEESEKYVLTRI